jgi:hypothetical protein
MIKIGFLLAIISHHTHSMELNTIVGNDHIASDSDDSTLIGNEGRLLSSDDVTELGTELYVNNSDTAVLIGSRLNASDSHNTVLIGSNLAANSAENQIVIGNYGAPSNASFVVAYGSEDTPRNVLEVHSDGRIENAHLARLEARIDDLTKQLVEFAEYHGFSCSNLTCSHIASAYTSQCCDQPGTTSVVLQRG